MSTTEKDLVFRCARFIAAALAEQHPEMHQLFRLHCAFDAACNLVMSAKWAGTYTQLSANVARAEALANRLDFEI